MFLWNRFQLWSLHRPTLNLTLSCGVHFEKGSWQIVFNKLFKVTHSYCYKITISGPFIDYCDVVWVPTNVGHLKRLKTLHSCFSSVDLASSSEFKLTLAEHRRFHAATQIYRIYTSCHLPIYILCSALLYLSQVAQDAMFIDCMSLPCIWIMANVVCIFMVWPSVTVCLPHSWKLIH